MTPKQFVELIEKVAEENGFLCTTDWEDGDSWGPGMKNKGCTIFAGDYLDDELGRQNYDRDRKKLLEIRKELWDEYLIAANKPVPNGSWEEGCLLNINFKNNYHHWTKGGQKAYQVMEIDGNAVTEEDIDSYFYPAFNSFDVFKSLEEAERASQRLHERSGNYHRIDAIELDEENCWILLDMIKKVPNV